jgi:hypothetical protein
MTPHLVLNHSLLTGIGYRTPAEAQSSLRELFDTLQRASRVRGERLVHVHPSIYSAEATDRLIFLSWAQRYLRDPDWSYLIDPLLPVVQNGPFVTNLSVDDEPRPTDSTPSCQHAPDWLRETLLIALHHGLSPAGRESWLLSYGRSPHLEDAVYTAERVGTRAQVRNFRSDASTRTAEEELSRARVDRTLDILTAAAKHAERVVVLKSAEKSAAAWDLDCAKKSLFDAIVGLDQYAKALDEGQTREQAAGFYTQKTGIEMSQEKANTLRKPTLALQRSFFMPNGKEKVLFDMHAKPGKSTRIYIRPDTETTADGTRKTMIYIGWCGKHLDLK